MRRILALLLLTALVSSSPTVRDEYLPFLEYYTELHDEADLAYRLYAFPHDELASYAGRGRDDWGGLAVQVIDSWDTLLALNRPREFHARVLWVNHTFRSYDIDVAVSVFETNIRVLGGLLAGHAAYEVGLVPTHPPPSWGVDAVPYDGALLRLAEDLHARLRAAFATGTGLPYGAVNLKSGVASGETSEVCLACCGTFSVEFNALSCLTNGGRFTSSHGEAERDSLIHADRSPASPFRSSGSIGVDRRPAHQAAAVPVDSEVLTVASTERGGSGDATTALNALARYSRNKGTGLAAMHVTNHDGRSTPQDASVGAQGDSLFETLHKASHASMMCEGKRASKVWGGAVEASLFMSDGGGRRVRGERSGLLEDSTVSVNGSVVAGGGRRGGSGVSSFTHGRGGVWAIQTSTTSAEIRDPIVVNSLSYFYNAVRVYDGDVAAAAATAAPLHALQRALGSVPEGMLLLTGVPARGQSIWPLRPEVVEGYAALSAATADTQWAEKVFYAVSMMAARGRSPVGYGGVVDTVVQPAVVGMGGPLSNKQETFLLGEVIKYAAASVGAMGLYGEGSGPYEGAFVMTTEAHPLPINVSCGAASPSDPSTRCTSSATTVPREAYSLGHSAPPSSIAHLASRSGSGGGSECDGGLAPSPPPARRRRLLSLEDALQRGGGGPEIERGVWEEGGEGLGTGGGKRAVGGEGVDVRPSDGGPVGRSVGRLVERAVVEHTHHPVVDLSRAPTPPKFRPSPHYAAPCMLVGMEEFLSADGVVVGGRGGERRRACT